MEQQASTYRLDYDATVQRWVATAKPVIAGWSRSYRLSAEQHEDLQGAAALIICTLVARGVEPIDLRHVYRQAIDQVLPSDAERDALHRSRSDAVELLCRNRHQTPDHAATVKDLATWVINQAAPERQVELLAAIAISGRSTPEGTQAEGTALAESFAIDPAQVREKLARAEGDKRERNRLAALLTRFGATVRKVATEFDGPISLVLWAGLTALVFFAVSRPSSPGIGVEKQLDVASCDGKQVKAVDDLLTASTFDVETESWTRGKQVLRMAESVAAVSSSASVLGRGKQVL